MTSTQLCWLHFAVQDNRLQKHLDIKYLLAFNILQDKLKNSYIYYWDQIVIIEWSSDMFLLRDFREIVVYVWVTVVTLTAMRPNAGIDLDKILQNGTRAKISVKFVNKQIR